MVDSILVDLADLYDSKVKSVKLFLKQSRPSADEKKSLDYIAYRVLDAVDVGNVGLVRDSKRLALFDVLSFDWDRLPIESGRKWTRRLEAMLSRHPARRRGLYGR